MKETYPSLFASLCESATLVSGLCAEALVQGGRRRRSGALMTYSHAVLARAGASNKRLDELVDLCLGSGCLGAKLTGAGRRRERRWPSRPHDARGGRARSPRSSRGEGYDAFFTKIPAAGARAWTE